MSVQTKDEGRFYAAWECSQMYQVTAPPKKQAAALPKAPKFSKRKKLAK